ncbi:MAG: ABC transporter ATP-binding protein [Rhodospirillales bacterium]|nr:ABC transporter ATP-binding protein [Acetobacter sp.]
MAEVLIRGVHKRFGEAAIIRGVDIAIPDGQFAVLVGPSGCGKTTLLRMIAGLEEISSGEISIGSRVINRVPAKDRDIAMVFQSYALYPHLSVADNLAFSLTLRRAKASVVKEAVSKAAAMLGLETMLERYPRQLSGGQRQRVAMGRALVRSPQVFLFDEPLSNLDAKLRASMRTEIKELQQRLKTTTIYVTHDQVEAMTMADLIVVMRDGRVEQSGTPMELYDRPRNTFVAGFIGLPEMNFIQAERQGPCLRLDCRADLPLPSPADLKAEPVLFGIRPEHLTIVPGQQSAAIAGTVAVVEPTGSETAVSVQTESGRVTVLLRERIRLTPGEPVSLQPAPGSGHVFDADGERLAAV